LYRKSHHAAARLCYAGTFVVEADRLDDDRNDRHDEARRAGPGDGRRSLARAPQDAPAATAVAIAFATGESLSA
jgi:hypothetical protein